MPSLPEPVPKFTANELKLKLNAEIAHSEILQEAEREVEQLDSARVISNVSGPDSIRRTCNG